MAFFKRTRRPARTRTKNPKEQNSTAQQKAPAQTSSNNRLLSSSIEINLEIFRNIFKDCSDVVIREFIFAQKEEIKLALIYTEGMVDKNQVGEQIMKALALEVPMTSGSSDITKANALHFIKMKGLCTQQVKESSDLDEILNAVLYGDTVLLVDSHAAALINSSKGWHTRAIEDSKTEMVVRGPRESFVETLRINTSMIRRKIVSPDLKIESILLGKVTKTHIAVLYIKGIVNEKLVQEVKKRLSRIKIDGILESGYIEELIRDEPFSIFPTIAHTDRPDRVAASLLEGRVAIIVDGTPVVLTMPFYFIESIQTPDDYYENYFFASAVRFLRLASLVIALTLPSFYVAIVSFHQEMLPTPLLLSIAAQREAVPFPVFVEALFMEIAFEIIRESGIRLPRPVGQAVSIVAALIIGQAAVEAGLVAGATIIVVALTAMASFTTYYSGSITLRLLRFPLMFLAATLGLFGLISGVILIVIHMASIRSFGVPYLDPIAPIVTEDLKDSLVRAPWWAMHKRPHLIAQNDTVREAAGMEPKPPRTKN
ncbi:spore germination protein KA [Desulfotomaculum arcticum]|uniref:Spore germination protein KA n=1 Tax=Desulfotruncus arcticus DSM 17038 TaxID=1121424 RepID=A0A1I2XE77_9FIRM|nr:spore germination protein [Desulfotruncus arcticus]SFH11798.1 spore germination protein KA [Desulfotomaculum arcticum] [Desulfotruncus arcticus DSM 17038]